MVEPRMNELAIQTPEGIRFGLALAGPFTRFLAWIIDAGCIVVTFWMISTVLGLFVLISPDFATALGYVVMFALTIGYGLTLEWFWRGQTVGKRMFGLRVVDESGLQLQFSQVAVRNLLRVVDMLPLLYLVGGVTCFLSPRNQRLGDLAAGTVVTRTVPGEAADLALVTDGKYNSFREHPHLQARLRQHVSPVEARLALDAVRRREALDDAERVRLFREMADHFRAAAAFPETATVGLTDEQYVRNVVDSLYAPRERVV